MRIIVFKELFFFCCQFFVVDVKRFEGQEYQIQFFFMEIFIWVLVGNLGLKMFVCKMVFIVSIFNYFCWWQRGFVI